MTAKPNPYKLALKQAEKDNLALGKLFARLGDTAHPNSTLLVAYRNARRAMRDVLRRGAGWLGAREVFVQLRLTTRMAAREVLAAANQGGQQSALIQMRQYEIATPYFDLVDSGVGAVLDVIEAKLDAQERMVRAVMLSGSDETLILGDEQRAGTLRASDIITTAVFWTAALFWNSWSQTVQVNAGRVQFQKQAIAALDERTTDCCLRVHGQIVPFDGKFRLTGTPRFADELEWTPFHHRCRSSVVLYQPVYDEGDTAAMQAGAQQIMSERAAGASGERHPADAFGN